MPLTQTMFTGMDMDTSYTLRDQKKYFKLRNGTLTIDEELGIGTIANVDGTYQSVVLPSTLVQPSNVTVKSIANDEKHTIIGACTVDDYVVLFSTNYTNDSLPDPYDPDGDVAIGAIWAFRYDWNALDSDSGFESVEDGTPTGTDWGYTLDCDVHLKFYDKLGFYTSNPIHAVGNSESDTVKKVYFVDGANVLRSINIVEDDVANNTIDHLELAENVLFNAPSVKIIPGGLLQPGQVQYAFQLFAYSGVETTVSPSSPLINISNEDYTLSNSGQFTGTEYLEDGEPTNKAAQITIENSDTNFEFIRVLRVLYTTEYSTPQIDIIAEFGIGSNDEDISFIDDGSTTLGTISLQEYLSIGGVIFTAEDITTSNNRLVASNINQFFYNPEYDARAYRYDTSSDCRIDDFTGTTYIIVDHNGDWEQFTTSTGITTGKTGSDWDWESSIDGFDPVIADQDTYNWIEDGADYIKGGKGPNISYVFDTSGILVDDASFPVIDQDLWLDSSTYAGYSVDKTAAYASNVQSTGVDQNYSTSIGAQGKDGDGWIDNTNEYASYAGAINSSLVAGYQRGETYRFGIVFFDRKGRSSFVHWIGDIKFPEMWDEETFGSGTQDYPLTSASVVGSEAKYCLGYSLGIKFTVDNAPEDAVSYQIVRATRTEEDKSIVASGYISPVGYGTWEDETFFMPATSLYRTWLRKCETWNTSIPAQEWIHNSKIPGWAKLFGGVYEPSLNLATLDWGRTYPFHITYDDNLFNLFSPEVSFLKTIELSNITMKLIGYYGPDESHEFGVVTNPSTNDMKNPFEIFFKSAHINLATTPTDVDIDGATVVSTETGDDRITLTGAPEYTHAFFGVQAYNVGQPDSEGHALYPGLPLKYWQYKDDRYWGGQGGTAIVGYSADSLSSKLTTAGLYEDYYIPYVQLRRSPVQYGGSGTANRRTVKYRPCSGVNSLVLPPGAPPTDSTVDVYQGDTFITMFEHTRMYLTRINAGTSDSVRDNGNYPSPNYQNKDYCNAVAVPVETTINCDWRSDITFSRADTESRGAMKEVKGSHDTVDGVIYNQEHDSYTMNWTYTKPSGSVLYEEEPLFFSKLTTQLSHRMMASDIKNDGEIADSWLKFKPNNFTDVNGENGPITAIEAIGEHLYFFQNKGVGVTRIDERALVNDSSGTSLVLGTGDIFSKKQYVADNVGVLGKESVVKGRNGIYFYDYVNKTIGALDNSGSVDVAKLKGVKSYIKNNFDKDIDSDKVNVISGYDSTKSMVYFSFLNSDEHLTVQDDFTIGYSEDVKDFVSLYDFAAAGYLLDKTRFLSWVRDKGGASSERGILHMHNVGDKGDFYGTEYDTVLTLLISDQPAITKVFDGIEYTHDADETLGSPPSTTQTFSRARCYNNFLDTGLTSIAPKFRFRTWRFKFPRFTEGSKENRLVGKYLKIDLEFDNSTNNELYLQPTLTTWRPIAFIQP